ncbi:hypothetical protein Pcinc_008038 [Petrolisthes cinctipes]|uniref:Uncharacterized protein n=1 Tax=Petrolisthes cinctipes TaxID=88211 RepID=A0AAE1KXN9_PETCI|nr:hypothetical protein Pcinc_008038 [Petrolisthes cinctipes]
MQCANIFFILSIGFAPAALACSEASADQSMTRMKIISPEKSFEVSTSEGIIRNKFELKEGEAASVMCPCIHLPHLEHQRLVISDELTGDELYRAKKFVSDQKKKFYRTGGGPPSPDIKPDAVMEKILALIEDELEPAPNYNDSDSWPRRADVTDIYFDEVGEQTSEPMPMTEEPSTAHIAPASFIPVEGNDHSPLPSTSSVTLFASTPLPSTSREAAFTHSSSNQRKPLPPTSVQTSVPATAPSEIPPIQPSVTSKRIGKKFKARKRKVEDGASRDSYETLSKFQKEEHDIVMKIYEQTLEKKRKGNAR